jgi:hypothetical protein
MMQHQIIIRLSLTTSQRKHGHDQSGIFEVIQHICGHWRIMHQGTLPECQKDADELAIGR